MKQAANVFFNIVSMIFVVLTAIVLAAVLAIAGDSMESPIFAPEATEPALAVVGIPSLTPSNTPIPTATSTPSDTPTPLPSVTNTPTATNTATNTPTITNTPAPTGTYTPVPTETPVPPTHTPTQTPTFTNTPTPTFSPTPTGPTPTATETLSPYPFTIQQPSPVLRENTLNGAGCNWQGVAGQITTNRGEPVVGIQVRVVKADEFDQITLSGSNLLYGASGWEMQVDEQVAVAVYEVSLWQTGEQVSPAVRINFPGTCQQNLATINFIQTRAF